MGGDNFPSANIDGVIEYLENVNNSPVNFFLVGNQLLIEQYLEDKTSFTINNEFYFGYSPERVNPGDKKNKFFKIGISWKNFLYFLLLRFHFFSCGAFKS